MKKIFGFFSQKKKKNKILKICLAVLLLVAVGVGAYSIFRPTRLPSLQAVSKNLNTYTMQIDYMDDYKFEATQSLKYKNLTGSTQDMLKFNLYATAFSKNAVNKPVSVLSIQEAYPNGENYGNYNITNVSINNKNVNFGYEGVDKNVLIVEFENPIDVNKSATVDIQYNFTMPNINHRYGYGNNAINVANFYPVLAVFENGEYLCDPYHSNGDPFYTDMANYEVTLTVPSSFKIAHTGSQVGQSMSGTNITYKYSAKAVRDFAFVMSEKFNLIEDKAGSVTIKYFYYKDEKAVESLKAAKDSILTFSELFGQYPYSTYSVVQTNFLHGGMEFPNLVYISDTVEKHSDYINVIIHETAHQWWYQLVGSNAYRNPWQDEGLTEFSTVMFYEKNPSYNVSSTEIIANATASYTSFIKLSESVLGSVNTSMNRHLHEYDTEAEYVYTTYVKGMLLFSDLRAVVGNKNFETALQTYLKAGMFKNNEPQVLITTFEQVCNTNLTSFFDSWINGKVLIKNFGN